jgi:guanine deaminase
MCIGAVRWANIKAIYYGATSADADVIGFRDKEFYEKEYLNLHNIDRAESLKAFSFWEKKEDKVLY